jgi:exodeoxyribonuclease VII large subunit
MPARRRDDDQPFLWDRPAARDPAPGTRGPGPERVPAPPPAPAEPQTLTVPQVAARLQELLAASFPEPFWLTGETADLRAGRNAAGHLYFSLVDDRRADDPKRACLSVTMWSRTSARLFGPRGRLSGRLQLENGLVLRVLVRPDFYAPKGRISFIIEDVDPDYTLGNLDLQRRKVLERLTAEGALQWNKDVALAAVPLRLGLITALESAAYNDVMQGLRACGLGFHVLCCDARMQGEQTSRSVRAALATLAARAPDCILLVRGGGSRLDLSWFDREDIARAIAACPVPVLTGIGHEIDLSVADAVAHRAFKTPTAVAEFLVQRALEAQRGSEQSWERIAAAAREQLAEQQRELLLAARGVRQAASGRVKSEASELAERCQQLRAATERALSLAREDLAAVRARLAAGPHVERLAEQRVRLMGDGERLRRAATARLAGAEAALVAAADRARLLDPRRVLGRGFAWLRRTDGGSLKDAAAAVPGEPLTALLRDGELDLRALAARPAPREPGPMEPAPGSPAP